MPGKGDGYVLDVQAELLGHLVTRVVVPLLPKDQTSHPITELNSVFEIKGKRHVLVTQALSAIPARELKRAVASLDAHHDAVIKALDLLLVGF